MKKIRKYLILQIILLLIPNCTFSQKQEYVYRDKNDSTLNCYLKIIPDGKKIEGLIIRDYSALPDTSKKTPFRLPQLALENNIMIIYTVTSDFFPEMYYTDSCIYILDDIVAEVIKTHKIPKENIFIGGISASGTRALRYAQFCAAGKSKYKHEVKGVFAVDSPLDLERFYFSVMNHKSNFKSGMLWEAELMTKVFIQKFGGSPVDFPQKYRNASVFAHNDSLGGNTVLLKETNLILFHEPDIDWWINERGSSYYDINSYDIAAFVMKLISLGNTKTELVTTTGKGFDKEGNRNCHSWTIVDEDYLMQWILALIE